MITLCNDEQRKHAGLVEVDETGLTKISGQGGPVWYQTAVEVNQGPDFKRKAKRLKANRRRELTF